MTTAKPTQRRHFMRVMFHTDAALTRGDREAPCQLLDLSLKGALLACANDVPAGDAPLQLRLPLADDASITMLGHVVGANGDRLHFRCDDIDLDSITHLRRLVALNAGDPTLLDRELTALIDAA